MLAVKRENKSVSSIIHQGRFIVVNQENPSQITLLDGGMGRELLRMGAPFQQPEWSALALIERPDLVKKAHESFTWAGSEVITTSNYAVVPFHLGAERFQRDGPGLTSLAGKLAQEVAARSGCRVAGSIPPVFGSYRPDLFIPDQAAWLSSIIVEALKPFVDLWLLETVSSIKEAEILVQSVVDDSRPIWISYTVMDKDEAMCETPLLRSGEQVKDAIHRSVELGISAILFNCSQPEAISPAVQLSVTERERLGAQLQVGVYANAFTPLQSSVLANTSMQELRHELGPAEYLQFVDIWQDMGAEIIGGCCGIGPEHIRAIYRKYLMNAGQTR